MRRLFYIHTFVAALVVAGCHRGLTLPQTDATAPLDLALGPATRLIVIAPHPDDEAIGAAGLMQQVIAAGGTVDVAVLTSGDGFTEGVVKTIGRSAPRPIDFRHYGALREKETVTAMAGLGVAREHVRFLGFPDGGLCALAARHLANRRRAYESPFTNRLTPPRQDQIVRGAAYRPSDLVRELERLLAEISPTLIAVTDQEDDHPDHCAAYIFTRDAIDRVAVWRTRPPRVLEYLVHYPHWPVQSFDLPLPLGPPPGFPRSGGPWRSVPLTADEAAVKLRTLHAYTSQMAVIGPLLNSFARGNELFVDGRPRERAECWCDAETVAR